MFRRFNLNEQRTKEVLPLDLPLANSLSYSLYLNTKCSCVHFHYKKGANFFPPRFVFFGIYIYIYISLGAKRGLNFAMLIYEHSKANTRRILLTEHPCSVAYTETTADVIVVPYCLFKRYDSRVHATPAGISPLVCAACACGAISRKSKRTLYGTTATDALSAYLHREESAVNRCTRRLDARVCRLTTLQFAELDQWFGTSLSRCVSARESRLTLSRRPSCTPGGLVSLCYDECKNKYLDATLCARHARDTVAPTLLCAYDASWPFYLDVGISRCRWTELSRVGWFEISRTSA